MKPGIRLGMVVSLVCTASLAEALERTEIALPVYQVPDVYVVDESGNRKNITKHTLPTGKFANLKVRIPKNIYEKNAGVPQNVSEAITELRAMLPNEYMEFLINRFGFVTSEHDVYKHRDLKYKFDDRILDLEVFLYDVWKLDELDRPLAKQIDCLGSFEYDLTPLFMLLTIEESYNRRGDMLADMDEAVVLTTTLKAKCL